MKINAIPFARYIAKKQPPFSVFVVDCDATGRRPLVFIPRPDFYAVGLVSAFLRVRPLFFSLLRT